ncbi:hypothetical protein BDB00DRAFT_832359 [Zychaea mexicana]|uniref:uncharacterized protein n=1 Tax=Zychaea mexicana TaxID=64656 RepID=UPI0022FF3A48|nr:uncharacterized protein BDB00DRAFT_832359 [Zychaea mexicana]KAI9491480.1 hypothetical protein BDB00DRAFT_832359 [Zychaea mexicana]
MEHSDSPIRRGQRPRTVHPSLSDHLPAALVPRRTRPWFINGTIREEQVTSPAVTSRQPRAENQQILPSSCILRSRRPMLIIEREELPSSSSSGHSNDDSNERTSRTESQVSEDLARMSLASMDSNNGATIRQHDDPSSEQLALPPGPVTSVGRQQGSEHSLDGIVNLCLNTKNLPRSALESILVADYASQLKEHDFVELVPQVNRLVEKRKKELAEEEERRNNDHSGSVSNDDTLQCPFCCNAPKNCLFLDCGHLACCMPCGEKVNG